MIKELWTNLLDCLGFGEYEDRFKDYCEIHKCHKKWWGSISKGEIYICEKCEMNPRRRRANKSTRTKKHLP